MKPLLLKNISLSFLLLVSFFLGYLFALRQYQIFEQKITETPIYIDVTTSKKSISIKEVPKNIFLRVNGSLIQSGSIDLKE